MRVRHEHALGWARCARGVHQAGGVGGTRQGAVVLGGVLPAVEVQHLQPVNLVEDVGHRLGGGTGRNHQAGAAVAQLVGEEVPGQARVDRHDDGAEPAQAEPEPDEVEAVRQQDRDRVARRDAQPRAVGGDLARLPRRRGIRQGALPDDGEEHLVAALPCLCLEDLGEDPAAVVVEVLVHRATQPRERRGMPCVPGPQRPPEARAGGP